MLQGSEMVREMAESQLDATAGDLTGVSNPDHHHRRPSRRSATLRAMVWSFSPGSSPGALGLAVVDAAQWSSWCRARFVGAGSTWAWHRTVLPRPVGVYNSECR
jgi:hypothetical protein